MQNMQQKYAVKCAEYAEVHILHIPVLHIYALPTLLTTEILIILIKLRRVRVKFYYLL